MAFHAFHNLLMAYMLMYDMSQSIKRKCIECSIKVPWHNLKVGTPVLVGKQNTTKSNEEADQESLNLSSLADEEIHNFNGK